MLRMVTDKVRQFFCGLHGHDTLRHFAKGRISLQCVTCGYETPGWDLRRGDRTGQDAERVDALESVAGRDVQRAAVRGDMAW